MYKSFVDLNIHSEMALGSIDLFLPTIRSESRNVASVKYHSILVVVVKTDKVISRVRGVLRIL